jgi:hypothetical protein
MISVNDWRKTLTAASGIKYSDAALDDDGLNYWPVFSGEDAKRTEPLRTVLPMQVWIETNRVVVMFYFEKKLWKIMQGYPSAGRGSGNAFRPIDGYSLSVIEQPVELPSSEMKHSTDNGVGPRFMCDPFCFSNVSDDPQELRDWSNLAPAAFQYGVDLVTKYMSQGIRFEKSGLCAPRYYAGLTTDVTDIWAIKQARKCGAFVPWLNDDGTQKETCE